MLPYSLSISSWRELSNDITFVWVRSVFAVHRPIVHRPMGTNSTSPSFLPSFDPSSLPYIDLCIDLLHRPIQFHLLPYIDLLEIIKLFPAYCVSFRNFRIRCAISNALFMAVQWADAGDAVSTSVASQLACHVTSEATHQTKFSYPALWWTTMKWAFQNLKFKKYIIGKLVSYRI